jgi:hypothetical protein
MKKVKIVAVDFCQAMLAKVKKNPDGDADVIG